MSFFKQSGQLKSAQFVLVPATLTTPLITLASDEFFDLYSVILTTNDTAIEQVVITDGTTTVATYFIGGGTTGQSIVDIATVPLRIKKGGVVTATATAITAAKSISVKVTGLVSKT
jgi:hypothetical protein